jgi:cytochrome c oxidase cbb3-type subunit I/II
VSEEKPTEKDAKKGKGGVSSFFPIAAGGLAVFFLMTSMVVAMPYMFYQSSPSERAHNYTAQEALGRDLYLKYGCFYCHSQFNRPKDLATGNVSLAGDYVYDNPASLGTERTGPDLAQIGGMRPTIWHHLHDRDPRSVSPGSVMPSFPFLTDEEIDSLTAYIQNEGGYQLQQMTYEAEVPAEYVTKTNPYQPLITQVLAKYDPVAQNFTGDLALGQMFNSTFAQGKLLFTQKCLPCHGCSGNGEGPYARHTLTRPANLNERIQRYPGDYYQFWRVSEGVSGTAMPAWKLSLSEQDRWLIITYEKSFVTGAIRTISGDISDAEGDNFKNATHIMPPITGTQQQFETGKSIFNLYCAQCHGNEGQGDGPAANVTAFGYITPQPANFTESGHDFAVFSDYGRYVWKVKEGVETTNMPPWKYSLSLEEIYQAIFYIQTFAPPDLWKTKWAPEYTDAFARNYVR